ncbi:hypothetical protein V2G26_002385 [Clonostachys chloroleuca]
MEPIAIIGISFKMPQEASDESSLWEVIEKKKNLMTEWPRERTNIAAFHNGPDHEPNMLSGRGGHFMNIDPEAFDAPFFSVTAKEAAAMDPQQRILLETSFHAFENAGIPVENLKNSQMAVFEASMSDDYLRMYSKDTESIPVSAATGTTASVRANRISWYYGLLGPSVHVDTACSSGMVAVDLACQSIRSGDASSALIIGCNLMLSPEMSVSLSNQGFLSPDSLCYSFDSRANGYARGEGFVAIIIKPLTAALEDGDTIRAIIRSVGSNQDGHTPGLSQPSADAQERLIRHVYAKANLDFKYTRYFEAHGTGTPTGDPIEMKAIGRVFRASRNKQEPLFVGSIKSNIGHLEGGSGLAGIVKAVLVLERGIIPPNALFKKLNPAIDASFYNVQVPTQSYAWPAAGLRRASVNSFGMGGTNAHIVLDDAYHYMVNNGLSGNHQVQINAQQNGNGVSLINGVNLNGNGESHDDQGTHSLDEKPHFRNGVNSSPSSTLLVWTAHDANALKGLIQDFKVYYDANVAGKSIMVQRLAHTLATRRSRMPWRAFALVNESDNLATSTPNRASSEGGKVAMIFTGQGAQYAGMGRELLHYPVFRQTMQKVNDVFAKLGCNWSIFDEILNPDTINRPEYSQPLCTALQISLIELLKEFGVVPATVVGHSSGEIAAAYAVGALSLEAASVVSYFRGQLAGTLAGSSGAMMSVNLDQENARQLLDEMASRNGDAEPPLQSVHVACINSPPARSGWNIRPKVNTGGLSYHTPAMNAIASKYLEALSSAQAMISNAERGNKNTGIPMISSVTGKVATVKSLSSAQYWVDNLVSPVRFLQAMRTIAGDNIALTGDLSFVGFDPQTITDVIEVGPHSALRRPINDTLQLSAEGDVSTQSPSSRKRNIRYQSTLVRGKSSLNTTLDLVGRLFTYGHAVSISASNGYIRDSKGLEKAYLRGGVESTKILSDLPKYPFDHSHKYWSESRISRGYRLRHENISASDGSDRLLGKPVDDWNPLEPRWKSFLSIETHPWLGGHVVNRITVLPGTGMLVMAIQAARHQFSYNKTFSSRRIVGYYINEAEFKSPIMVGDKAQDATEVITQLRNVQGENNSNSLEFDIVIFCISNEDLWNESCHCRVELQLDDSRMNNVDSGAEQRFEEHELQDTYHTLDLACQKKLVPDEFYDAFRDNVDVDYGTTFRLLENIKWDGHHRAIASVDLDSESVIRNANTSRVPVTAMLDASVHLVLTQVSKGLVEFHHTLVLHKVTGMWISDKAWNDASSQQPSSVRLANSMVRGPSKTGNVKSTIFGLGEDGSVLFRLKHVDMAAVSQIKGDDLGSISKERGRLLHTIDWKPQLSLLNSDQLGRLMDKQTPMAGNESLMVKFYPKMEFAMIMAARKALEDGARPPPGYLERLVASINALYIPDGAVAKDDAVNGIAMSLENGRIPQPTNTVSDDELELLLKECEDDNPSWEAFPVIARQLKPVISGEMDPLNLIFPNGLAEKYYKSLFQQNCDNRFRLFLELLCHETPGISVLEVGGGTGGMTEQFLSAISEIESTKGITCISEYTFTDISPAFFEHASEKFGDYSERMIMKKFDLEREPEEEGFTPAAYDVVVAGSVVHATRDVTKTLKNLRRLIKPGGYLILLEIVDAGSASGNVGFGVFPGWWLSSEEWRPHSPLLTEKQWDVLLKKTGFSGNHLVLRDYSSDICHISSIIVSKTVGDDTIQNPCPTNGVNHSRPITSPYQMVVLIDKQSSAQAHLAELLLHNSQQKGNAIKVQLWSTELQQPEYLNSILQEDTVVISLLEVGQPFFSKISGEDFATLKSFIRTVRNLLWVTYMDVEDPEFASASLMKGFFRTIRSEAVEKNIVTLSLDGIADTVPFQTWTDDAYQAVVGYILTTVLGTFVPSAGSSTPLVAKELEYVVEGGMGCIGRLVEESSMNQKLQTILSPQLRSEPWSTGPGVVLNVGTPGALDTLHFVEDPANNQPLDPDEIEIEPRAWPVNFRDILIALGRIEYDTLGMECAGFITKIGANYDNERSGLSIGDRVCICSYGSIRRYARSHAELVYKIPDNVSFEAAVSAITPGTTAYYGLVDLAQLKPGESVLIHSAAGATGQMAVHVAQFRGATVFATVGHDEKKKFLVDKFGLQEDHIFYSRDYSFKKGIKRITGGRGVDVVFNSLSGKGLRASWECVAPYGRFLDISKADMIANASLPMSSFQGNVSYFGIDVHHMGNHNIAAMKTLFTRVMSLLEDGTIHHPKPLHCYSITNIENSLRFMQGGKNIGRVIITASPTDVVPKLSRDPDLWTLNPLASYLVVGGLGGLGRAILAWMANKGARHLIVLSRSGLSESNTEAMRTVKELREQGVKIITPACDASSLPDLSTQLAQCAQTMPAIAGCINAAMSLQDAVFENMAYEQWALTIDSKVKTTFNLHQLLPVGSLDFFVLFSSLSGIYGSIAQSNYAAGCTYQDAIAKQRASTGENAVSLDIGWMRTIGIIAEKTEYQRNRENTGDMMAIESEELLGVLSQVCRPAISNARHQVLIGAVTPEHFYARGKNPAPSLQRPLFSGFGTRIAGRFKAANQENSTEDEPSKLFKQATSSKEKALVVARAIIIRIARALAIPAEEVESSKQLSDYGVDSLMAVELRNWIGRDFQTNVAVFEIMSGTTIQGLGQLVAERAG